MGKRSLESNGRKLNWFKVFFVLIVAIFITFLIYFSIKGIKNLNFNNNEENDNKENNNENIEEISQDINVNEKTIEQIKNTCDLYFIIAVDASLPILKKYKIKADIVVCEESQIAIAKAFIGCKKYAEYSVAGLTSCHNTVCTSAKNNSWFIPIYENTNFLTFIPKNTTLYTYEI